MSIYDAKHDFLVWLRNGSNPADINRFRNHSVIFNNLHIVIHIKH